MKNVFVDYVLDLLFPYGNIKAKAMFDSYGIYKEGIIAGIIIQDELYFKADKGSSPDYEAAGSKPFSHLANNKIIKLSYWLVPPEVIEDPTLLETWFDKTWQISLKSKIQKSR